MTLLGLCGAVPLWRWVFRGKHFDFWTRITTVSSVLGWYALWVRPELREWPTKRDMGIGVLSAGGLYLVFQLGDRVVRVLIPGGAERIASVYALREIGWLPLVTAELVAVVAPAEELFWRGLVQHVCIVRFGRWPGTLAGTALYSAIQLVSGNAILGVAGAVAGAYWGAEYAVDPRLGPVISSHVIWDLWIFRLKPTPGGQKPR